MSFNLSNPDRPIEAGVILMGETELLDVATIDLLHGITPHCMDFLPLPDAVKAGAPEINFHWVTEKGNSIKLTANMTISATDSFESCPTLDIVLIGAYNMGYTPSDAELAFISKSYEGCVAFINICGGFLPAQLAGVLVGKTATGPRFMVPELQKQDPRTTWVEKRYVRDGKIWTSGTLLNGLDLMREFMLEYWPELARTFAIQLGGLSVRDVEYHGADGFPVVA